MPEHSTAPWSPAEVESLNAYQGAGVMHPFTCGTDTSHGPLRATVAGWRCRRCDYKQAWALAWMADGSWRDAFPEHPLEALRRLADG